MRLAGDARGASAAAADCLRAFEGEVDFIFGSLRRHGVTVTDAQDLTQEIFVIMWRRWQEYDASRPLRPWVAGIIYRVTRRHLIRRRRFLLRGLIEIPDPGPSQDDDMTRAQARLLLATALDRLPGPQRTVVVMHELEGIPMREVATLHDIPLFTAYTRLRTARRNLAHAVAALERRRAAGTPPSPSLAAFFALERDGDALPPGLRRRLVATARASAHDPERAAPRRPPTAARSPALPLIAGAIVLVALALVLAVAPRSHPAPPSIVTSGSALARWTFDEPMTAVARDVSGNGHDCRIRGPGGPPRSTVGVSGGALLLDGAHWLECPGFDPRGRLHGALSITLWLRPSSDPPAHPDRQVLVTRQLGATGDRLFSLRLQNGSLELLSHVWRRLLRRPYRGRPGSWTHVAAVREPGGTSLYVDGVLIGRNTIGDPVTLGGAGTTLVIGGQLNGVESGGQAQDLFRGAIDELAVHDRALGADEIRDLAGEVGRNPGTPSRPRK